MARTESTNIPLGFQAPSFSLFEPTGGKKVSLLDVKSNKATVIIFMCNHCPYVKHLMREIVKLSNEYIPKGISFIGINSNDVENYPDDSPEMMVQLVKESHLKFPYLFDETQEVAKAYDAACTPEFHVFDYQLKCVYRGQFDDSRPSNDIPVTGKDLRETLDAILTNSPINPIQRPGIGCNIKWKS